MDNDWRLVNQANYLFRKQIMRTVFKVNGERDHAHCAFCWDKFSESPNKLHVGYCTLDKYWWICEQCYRDFKDQFEWEVVN